MEKYQKVQKPRDDKPFNENEMRITSLGLLGNYVNYATAFFQVKNPFFLGVFDGLMSVFMIIFRGLVGFLFWGLFYDLWV